MRRPPHLRYPDPPLATSHTRSSTRLPIYPRRALSYNKTCPLQQPYPPPLLRQAIPRALQTAIPALPLQTAIPRALQQPYLASTTALIS